MQHNCNNCKFKGFVPDSSHHISCTVLRVNGINSDVKLLELLMSTNQVELINTTTNEPHVKINEYGKKNGWANYPLNFDPIWIEHCELYINNEKSPN